jgi:Helix-turn-helix domain
MSRHNRDFKGVWIPKEIWLSDQLSLVEKALFVEIHSLDNERGCFASNEYFANFFTLSARQIRTHIASLKTKGLISVSVRDRNQRTIRTVGRYRRISVKEREDLADRKMELAQRMRQWPERDLPRG